MSYPPHGGYQPPAPQRRTPIIIAFSIAGVALLIAIGAVVVVLVKNDSDSGDDQAVQQTTETVQEQAPQTHVQTETQTQTVAPPPNRGNVQQRLESMGYVNHCNGSTAYMESNETSCGWVIGVEQELNRRGGPFNNVPVYSAYLGKPVPATCTDQGDYYRCQGQNHAFAFVK